MASHSSSCC